LEEEKVRTQYEGNIKFAEGTFAELSGKRVTGYEIHMGRTLPTTTADDSLLEFTGSERVTGYARGNVYGSYVHGIFDNAEICSEIVAALAARKGIDLGELSAIDYAKIKEREYDRLADTIREYMDMDRIYEMLRESRIEDPVE